MGKKTIIWLIIAAALILIGATILSCVMAMLNWDFSRLTTVRYETTQHEIREDFTNIAINSDTADIDFVVSEKPMVVCHEQENAAHRVAVEDGSLVIKVVDERKWYDHIGIGFDIPKITLYLPQREYGALSITSSTGDVEIPGDFSFRRIDIAESTGRVTNYASATESVTIKTTTGSIHVENITAGWLDLTVSTGKVTVSGVNCQGDTVISVSTGKANISNLTCKNLLSSGDTGDLFLNNTVAAEKFTIIRSTGDVTLARCDAAEIFIETDTGSVTGSLLTEKIFVAQSDTGRVDVPRSVTGGRCEITTDTGKIKITVE